MILRCSTFQPAANAKNDDGVSAVVGLKTGSGRKRAMKN